MNCKRSKGSNQLVSSITHSWPRQVREGPMSIGEEMSIDMIELHAQLTLALQVGDYSDSVNS